MSFDGWRIVDTLAVAWDEDMEARFPAVEHDECRVLVSEDRQTFVCRGWHCNRCGAPTNSFGGHECPDRP